jgi:UDP:flavonoid glycosyltransferase YjiC (YdhE family)
VKPEDIVSALLAVLEAGSYRESAKRIQRSFRDAGGSAAAADGLEGLVARAAA